MEYTAAHENGFTIRGLVNLVSVPLFALAVPTWLGRTVASVW
jgi:hypothetical protein